MLWSALGATMGITAPAPTSDPNGQALVDRWPWLGVVGTGLIAAAITAIALPPAREDINGPPPAAPTAQQPTT